MSNSRESFDKADLGGGAALSACGCVDKLQSKGGRVDVLKEMQSQHDRLENKLFEDRAALEAKFQILYEPFYAKRHDIVNGVTNEAAVVQGVKTVKKKGVPDFWLDAMKNNKVLSEEITKSDEKALKFLKDIKWCRIDDPKGFKLDFFFHANPYFKNSVLTKTYHMIGEDEPILEKAIGTDIIWCRKSLGSKSFFNLFRSSPANKFTKELQIIQMEQDYDIGSTIRDKIIPHAVSWFTGEAVEDCAAHQNKLQSKAERVDVLKEMQSQHDELEKKFFEERSAMEAKYQKLCEPLYAKRHDIVNGVTNEAAVDQGVKAVKGKGVPYFWLNAMKNNKVLSEEITGRDERALKYLKDIKCCRIDDPKGLKLEFFFHANPYLRNSVLTKTYHMIGEDEPILEKAIGTHIDWYPGKSLTQKNCNKKKKRKTQKKPRKGSCESFFNFFSPPEIPDDEEEIVEELQNQMELDYNIGSTIRDKIIPHAVSWFTREEEDDDDEAVLWFIREEEDNDDEDSDEEDLDYDDEGWDWVKDDESEEEDAEDWDDDDF